MLLALFLLTPPIKNRGNFNICLTSDVSCGYGSGWGDVNFLVNLHAFSLPAHYVDHVAWARCGDGWGDVNVRVRSLAVDLQLAIQIQQWQRPLDSCATCLGAHPRKRARVFTGSEKTLFLYDTVGIFADPQARDL